MANDSTEGDTPVIIFDGWRSLIIAIYMALVGYTVMVSVPVLSTALVAMAGFTEVQVGRIWGADLGGFSAGAVLSAFLVARVNRRKLVLFGVLLSVVSNASCMVLVDYDQVLWLRATAGVGSGIFTAVAVVSLGGTTNPVRAFNILLFGFAISTALELHFFPQLEMNQIYLLFILLALLCAVAIKWLPSRPLNTEELAHQKSIEEVAENWRVPGYFPIICLVAVCFTYINIGGYYTYIELAALADGVAADWVGAVLTASSVFGVVGCIIALFCSRFGLFKPLFCSLLLMGTVVVMLAGGIGKINIVVSLFAFMALWTFIDVFQSGMLSYMDRKGSLVALLPSVQGFGQFVGPNVAASALEFGFGYRGVFLVSGAMSIVAMVIYLGIYFYMRRHQSSPAQAA
ncbi:MAG: MFS transporter [Porticoccaceae bacterium]|jgi:predicted MFS family arabinose efflux permease|nr:MFS transporter [Porticoccaceae bacterium]|tara:strand:+ start:6610 stop:7812 length:1203 start_codon:yes stop_codon:yes gene_type:complete